MNDRGQWTLLIDPRPMAGASGSPRAGGDGPFQILFSSEGEYARALAAVLASEAGDTLPDEAVLHLFAFEALERANECAHGLVSGGSAVFVLPLWPACLFEAAGIEAHAAAEIEILLPPFPIIRAVIPGPDDVAQTMTAWLGAPRADPAIYVECLRRTVRERNWEVV